MRAVVGRCNKPRLDMHYQHGPISTTAGAYARELLWSNAGISPDEVDLTGSSYYIDVHLHAAIRGLWLLRAKAMAVLMLATARHGSADADLITLSGGLLCEGYTHGMSLAIENVRQLRPQTRTSETLPGGPDGRTAQAHL